METFIQQVFTLLTTPPGNLIYHLGLSFSVIGALQAAQSYWRSSQAPQGRRMVFGLSILLAAQLVLFLGSGLAWQGLVNPNTLLPPLDRAVTAFSLLWIVWLWAYPERVPAVEAIHIFANIILGIYLAFSLVLWADQSLSLSFNLTWFDFIWELFALGIVLLGILALLLRRPAAWGTGLAMLGMILVGYLVQLFVNLPPGDFLGAVRLSLLASYPLLLSLPQRFSRPAETTRTVPTFIPHPITQERRRYSTDPKTLQAFLSLVGENTVPNLPGAVTRILSHAVLADLTFLVSAPESGVAVNLEGGYDLIREETLPGTSIPANRVPQIASALQKGRVLSLVHEDGAPVDLENLADAIGLNHPGNLLLIPLVDEGEKAAGGILFLSPYANRIWSTDDQSFLMPLSRSLVRILQRYRSNTSIHKELDQALTDLETAQIQNEQVRQSYQDLLEQYESLRAEDQQKLTQNENLAALVAVQQEYQDIIEHLQSENERLQEAANKVQIFPVPGLDEKDALETELNQTHSQVSQLRNALNEANLKVLELEKSAANATPLPEEQAEVISSLAQELRQPMSSISGYTDLLLGESVGILGALQRKFLERIKASTERMRSLIDDLIHTIALESGNVRITPQSVDLGAVIDDAVMFTSAQLREKNITLRVDLPEQLPQLHADRDALQQIVIHLLQNAGAATPLEGTVSLKVRVQGEKDQQDYLLVQITDTGGGIPAEELPRVFSRLYRADNVLIQGVGDTGVGLSIAKTLVEAHGGRIWVDSQMGQTTTFSVLLPILQGQTASSTAQS